MPRPRLSSTRLVRIRVGCAPSPRRSRNGTCSRSRNVIDRSAGTVSSTAASRLRSTRRFASSGSRSSTGSSSRSLPSSTRIIAATAVTGFVIDAMRKIVSRRYGRAAERRGAERVDVEVVARAQRAPRGRPRVRARCGSRAHRASGRAESSRVRRTFIVQVPPRCVAGSDFSVGEEFIGARRQASRRRSAAYPGSCAVKPPSIRRISPVTNAAPSDAR